MLADGNVKTEEEKSSSIDHEVIQTHDAKSKSSGGRFGIFLLSIVVIAMGLGGGYFGMFLWGSLSELEAKQNQFNQSIAELDDEMLDLRRGLSAASDQEQQLHQKIDGVQQLVGDLRQYSHSLGDKFSAMKGADRYDWLISEVEHYIKLANQRLELTHDAVGAALLLQQSIEIARSIEVPGVIAFRKSLIADRVLLEQVSNVDVEGIFLELSVISQNIEKMKSIPLAWDFTESQSAVDVVEEELLDSPAEEGKIYNQIWKQWADFFTNHLVRVHQVDEPVTPFLKPADEAYLKQNLMLLISQAQLSVMRGEGGNYQIAIDQAAKWIEKYYDKEDSITKSTLSTLGRLQAQDIEPTLPRIDRSLQAVRDLRENWIKSKTESLSWVGGVK